MVSSAPAATAAAGIAAGIAGAAETVRVETAVGSGSVEPRHPALNAAFAAAAAAIAVAGAHGLAVGHGVPDAGRGPGVPALGHGPGVRTRASVGRWIAGAAVHHSRRRGRRPAGPRDRLPVLPVRPGLVRALGAPVLVRPGSGVTGPAGTPPCRSGPPDRPA